MVFLYYAVVPGSQCYVSRFSCVTVCVCCVCVCVCVMFFFFLMIRRPPRSTLDRSSAASDVYKRQITSSIPRGADLVVRTSRVCKKMSLSIKNLLAPDLTAALDPVSYTHLRAHETVLDLVCRLLLEKKKTTVTTKNNIS